MQSLHSKTNYNRSTMSLPRQRDFRKHIIGRASRLIIDTSYNVYSDARGADPDSTSATLRQYHKVLWSKPLHNGKLLELVDNQKGVYLYHNSEIGQFTFGSDAITH